MREKHQLNVKRKFVINFQIGLIAALTFVYILFEVVTTSSQIAGASSMTPEPKEELQETIFVIEKEPEQKKVAKVEQPKVLKKVDEFEIKEDNLEEFIKKEAESEAPDHVVNPSDIVEVISENPTIESVPFIAVEFVPVYPGCERLKTNKQRSVCFQEKIQRMISKKFNSGLGQDLGLEGRQRIAVMFEVDERGKVTNIKARAKHPKLEKEAVRVIKLLPEMKPGMQRDHPVTVQYSLPIIFQIQ